MFEHIEIMDTTLRDGEQTEGLSFSGFEKLQLARFFIEELQVDRIEIASARVSASEHETAREIFQWALSQNCLEKIEVLGFVDGRRSVDWISSAGGKVLNLLSKGSKRHCELQLRKNLKEHLRDIESTLQIALDEGLKVQLYLEDWSSGFLHSPEYVREMLKELMPMPISRFLLPDTLGILAPDEVRAGIEDALKQNPQAQIDFHGHNDYSLAVANCLAAVQAGVRGLHVSVNGLGERAGNAPLEAVVTALHDKLALTTSVNEKAIMDASRLVESFSGKRIQANRPIVGQDVYTQTAGIHADGDKKANLYANPILPERFGRRRVYALGKLAGLASISNNLKTLGIQLTAEKEQIVLRRVKELGEKKKIVTADDLPFIIEDLFGLGFQRRFKVKECSMSSSSSIPLEGGTEEKAEGRLEEEASARIAIEFEGQSYKAQAQGSGAYDAFMNALTEITKELKITLPQLLDYEVHIPPGGKTDALVEAVISWQDTDAEKGSFRTVGVATDQALAAVYATEKMLNRLLVSSPSAPALK